VITHKKQLIPSYFVNLMSSLNCNNRLPNSLKTTTLDDRWIQGSFIQSVTEEMIPEQVSIKEMQKLCSLVSFGNARHMEKDLIASQNVVQRQRYQLNSGNCFGVI